MTLFGLRRKGYTVTERLLKLILSIAHTALEKDTKKNNSFHKKHSDGKMWLKSLKYLIILIKE